MRPNSVESHDDTPNAIPAPTRVARASDESLDDGDTNDSNAPTAPPSAAASVPKVGSTEFAANSSLAGTTCGMPAVSAASKNRFTESAEQCQAVQGPHRRTTGDASNDQCHQYQAH